MAVTVRTHIPLVGPERLRINVSDQGTTTTIQLEGEFDLAEKEAVRLAVHAALDRGPERLVLDLSGLSFIDSSGLHVVIETAKRSTRQNIALVIIPGLPAVQRVFEITGLLRELPFTPAVRPPQRPHSAGAEPG